MGTIINKKVREVNIFRILSKRCDNRGERIVFYGISPGFVDNPQGLKYNISKLKLLGSRTTPRRCVFFHIPMGYGGAVGIEGM